MSCPHSSRSDADPSHCSQCLGATVTRIAPVDVDKAIESVTAKFQQPQPRERPIVALVAAIVGTHNDLRARRPNEERD